jgi:hypothetical protein
MVSENLLLFAANNYEFDKRTLNFISESTNQILSDFWLSKIPMFMKFRQICKFSWFFNPENIDDHQKERIRNIENNILFTDCTINPLLFSNENK